MRLLRGRQCPGRPWEKHVCAGRVLERLGCFPPLGFHPELRFWGCPTLPAGGERTPGVPGGSTQELWAQGRSQVWVIIAAFCTASVCLFGRDFLNKMGAQGAQGGSKGFSQLMKPGWLELCLSPAALMDSPPCCTSSLVNSGSSLPVGDPEGWAPPCRPICLCC